MKLIKARVTEFRSIKDSTEFEIGDITCLVGKNESGKTALLKALYKLNPIIETDGSFDVTDDYPRRDVSDYEDAIENGEREHAKVIHATYLLEEDDIKAVTSIYGDECFKDNTPIVSLSKGYDNELSFSNLLLNKDASLSFLISAYDLPGNLAAELKKCTSIDDMLELLTSAEQSESIKGLEAKLKPIAKNGFQYVVYNNILSSRLPKYLYFDDYYQMKGQDNIEALQKRLHSNALLASDYPLLGLIELARLNLAELTEPSRTEALLSKLEAAENQLTSKVLKYWSQNRHIRLKFDIRPGQSGDPEGMTSGTNIWGRVVDTKHMVSTPLRSRSKGFVWFFSFLAWYSQLKRKGENIVLLLDEPGLSLHAKAQADLLSYFEKELRPSHQVIYSTHSPFLVDATRFEQVRIVQDLSVESENDNLPASKQGTKVITEVLEASPDSLFPLQGALGYEIHQSLFIGPNSLIVEGVSDLLYLQSVSSLLQSKGEPGLDNRWVITPVGGSDKVSTFAALVGAQSNLNIAVLIDYQKKDKQSIENLFKKKLLEKKSVLTFADFTDGDEADIEDMFNDGFYLKLINGEYGSNISVSDLEKSQERLLSRVEKYLEANPLPNGAKFNHYRPARYFVENSNTLKKELTATQLDRFRNAFSVLNKLL